MTDTGKLEEQVRQFRDRVRQLQERAPGGWSASRR